MAVLQSCFDHKGSKQFLAGKSEAMQKIELNESILDENQNKNKKLNEHSSSRLNSIINAHHLLNKIKGNNKYISYCSINNNSKKNKMQNEEFKNNNGYPADIYFNKKNIKSSKKNEKYLNTDINNLDLSIDSKISISLQLFNNYKEYKNNMKLISEDDIIFYKELLSELKSNKNKNQ